MVTKEQRLKAMGKLQCEDCGRYFEDTVHLSYHLKDSKKNGVVIPVCMDEDEMIYQRMEYVPKFGEKVWQSTSERPKMRRIPAWLKDVSADWDK